MVIVIIKFRGKDMYCTVAVVVSKYSSIIHKPKKKLSLSAEDQDILNFIGAAELVHVAKAQHIFVFSTCLRNSPICPFSAEISFVRSLWKVHRNDSLLTAQMRSKYFTATPARGPVLSFLF